VSRGQGFYFKSSQNKLICHAIALTVIRAEGDTEEVTAKCIAGWTDPQERFTKNTEWQDTTGIRLLGKPKEYSEETQRTLLKTTYEWIKKARRENVPFSVGKTARAKAAIQIE
jgi:hypothetical protein